MSKHTKGQWRRGFTYITRITQHWGQEQLDRNNIEEGTRIFANMRNSDEGRSRILIAQLDFTDPNYEANAKLIAAAPELKERLVITNDTLSAIIEEYNVGSSGTEHSGLQMALEAVVKYNKEAITKAEA